jgi:hypothetical protein
MMLGAFADTRKEQAVDADETIALQEQQSADVLERHQRRESRFRRWRPRFQYGWALHFIVTLSLIFCAIYANGGTL